MKNIANKRWDWVIVTASAIVLIIALALVAVFAPREVAHAATEPVLTEAVLTYELNTEKTGYIVTGTSSTEENLKVTVPATYDGKPIVEINDNAFKGNTGIKSLTLESSSNLKTIGDYAFSGCSQISSLTFATESSLEYIDSGAFYNCSGISNALVIPASVTKIGISAFSGCSQISSLTFAKGSELTTIHSSAFRGCKGISNALEIPDLVTKIGDYAFIGCSNITGELVIPASVTIIDVGAFNGCSSITGLTFESGIKLKTIGASAFSYCSNITGELKIPASVTKIDSRAFENCSSITGKLVIPALVTEIGYRAFENCSSITGELVIPDSVTEIGFSAFRNCSSITGELVIPASVTAIKSGAFYGCSSITGELVIPDKVTSIGDSAFSGCSGIEGVLTIPNLVTEIGGSAFNGCSEITGLTFATLSELASIGNHAFYNCSGIVNALKIPASVTTIGISAFSGCLKISSLTFATGSELASIGDYAFQNCSSITGELVIPASVNTIGSNAFSGCLKINSITFATGSELASIGNQAFYNCSGISNALEIPASVNTIGDFAFYNCSGISGLTFASGSKLASIGDNAFYDCSGIDGVLTIPNTVTTIGISAFHDCSQISSLTFASGSKLASIGYYAFYNCSGIEGVLTIPNLVTTIGISAFQDCSNIRTVYLSDNDKTTYGTQAFTNITCPIVAASKALYDAYTSTTVPHNLGTYKERLTYEADVEFRGDTSIYQTKLYNQAANYVKAGDGTWAMDTNYALPIMPNNQRGEFDGWCLSEDGTGTKLTNDGKVLAEVYYPAYAPYMFNVAENGMGYTVTGFNPEYLDTLTEVEKNKIELVIPANYDIGDGLKPIVAIGDNAFSGNTGIKSVTFESGSELTTIGSSAFQDCSGIIYGIEIPTLVTKIGDNAFKGCSGITGLTFATSSAFTSIGDNAFSGCFGMSNALEIPALINIIGDYAFSGCSQISSLTFASGSKLASIGDYAFYNCSGISNALEIPALVNTIGKYSFHACSGISGLTFASGSKLASIGDYAFRNCSGITELIIPNSVKYIGREAFDHCDKLTKLTFASESVLETINDDAFYSCTSITGELRIPASVKTIGEASFGGCASLTSLVFEDGSVLQSIGIAAFADCEKLSGVIVIPNTVTEIGSAAFSGCTGISVVYLPNNPNTVYGEEIFRDIIDSGWLLVAASEALYKDYIESTHNLFDYKDKLTYEVTFDSMGGSEVTETKLYNQAANYVKAGDGTWAVSASYELPIPERKDYRFIGWYPNADGTGTMLTESGSVIAPVYYAEYELLVFDAELNASGYYVINGFTDGYLKSLQDKNNIAIEIPQRFVGLYGEANVAEIGDNAFSANKYVGYTFTSLSFNGNALDVIGAGAFDGRTTLLGGLIIPGNVKSIGANAFRGCVGFESLEIAEYMERSVMIDPFRLFGDLRTIGSGAFEGCSGFSGVLRLPMRLQSVGANAFSGCVNLSTVYLALGNSEYDEFVDYGAKAFGGVTCPLVAYNAEILQNIIAQGTLNSNLVTYIIEVNFNSNGGVLSGDAVQYKLYNLAHSYTFDESSLLWTNDVNYALPTVAFTDYNFAGWASNGEIVTKDSLVGSGVNSILTYTAATSPIFVSVTVGGELESKTQDALSEFDYSGLTFTLNFKHGESVLSSALSGVLFNVVYPSGRTALQAGDTSLTMNVTYAGVTVGAEITGFTVRKLTYSGITFEDASADYDGSAKTIEVSGLPNGVTVSYSGTNGYASGAVNAGVYVVTAAFTVADSVNYEAPPSMQATLTINKLKLIKPTLGAGEYTYSGEVQEVALNGYEVTTMTKSGASGTNAGSYTAVIGLKDTINYEWADGTSANLNLSWEIAKAKLVKPSLSAGEYTYNGEVQEIALNGYEVTTMTKSGASGTNAGSYTAVIGLKDTTNYEWADGTSANLNLSWEIAKAKLDMSGVTFESLTVKEDGSAKTVVVSGLPSGVTVTYSGTNGYVAGGVIAVGTYVVTATFSVTDDNYEIPAPMTATLKINVAEVSGGRGDNEDDPKVTIGGESGIDPDIVVNVEDKPADGYKDVDVVIDEEECEIMQVTEITLTKDDVTVSPDGTITVRLKIDEELRGYDNIKIVIVKDDGTTEEVNVKREGDYLSFETDNYSMNCAVVVPKKDLISQIIDKGRVGGMSGGAIAGTVMGGLLFLLLLLLLLMFLLRKDKEKGFKEYYADLGSTCVDKTKIFGGKVKRVFVNGKPTDSGEADNVEPTDGETQVSEVADQAASEEVPESEEQPVNVEATSVTSDCGENAVETSEQTTPLEGGTQGAESGAEAKESAKKSTKSKRRS